MPNTLRDNSFRKLPFSILIFTLFGGYLTVAIWFPLLPYVNQVPQQDVLSLAPSLGEGILYGLLLVGLFIIYGVIFWRIREGETAVSLPSLLAVSLLCALPLLLTYPINATDIYRYIVRGRIKSAYGLNQFDVPPIRIEMDPFVAFAGEWSDATSPYGPLWELVATAVTAVSGTRLTGGILLFKLVALLCFMGIGYLVWTTSIEHTLRSRTAATWLWLGNPALMFTFVVNGHNDALMLFWGVAAFLLLKRKRPYGAIVCVTLAALSKPIGLLIFPFIWLPLLRQLSTWKRRLLQMLLFSSLTIIVVWIIFLPFGSPLPLIRRLVQELAGGAGFSWVALLVLSVRQIGWPITLASVVLTAQLLFAGYTFFLMWQVWNGRSPFRQTTFIFAGYFYQAANFRIWYASWLLPWLLLEKPHHERWVKTAVFFLLTSQLSVLIYGHMRVFLLGDSHLLAHLIGVPFTFLLPIWLASRVSHQ